MVCLDGSCYAWAVLNSRYVWALGVISVAIACKKPADRPRIDVHLQDALLVAAKEPEKAFEYLQQVRDKDAPEYFYARGLAFESQKKVREAIAEYQRVHELQPSELRARSALGRLLLLSGDVPTARAHLDAVAAAAPDELPALLLLSVSAGNPDESKAALTRLRAWPQARPEDTRSQPVPAEFWLTVAAFEHDSAKADEALAFAKKAEVSSPAASLAVATYAERFGKRRLSALLVAKLADGSPLNDPAQVETLAELALDHGQLPQAQKVLEQGTRHRTPGLFRSKGRLALLTNRSHEAVEYLTKALALAREEQPSLTHGILLTLATAQAKDDNLPAALQSVDTLIAAKPEPPPELLLEAKLLSSDLLLASGEAVRAVALLETLSKEHPAEPKFAMRLGTAQLKARDPAGAVKTFQALVNKDPEDLRALELLVSALNADKRAPEAMGLLQAAAASTKRAAAFRALANQFLHLKQPAQALEALKNAPIDESNRLEMGLLLADTYQTLKRPKEMRATLEQLVQQLPNSAAARVALATELERSKEWEPAEVNLRRAMELEPDNQTHKARLASLLLHNPNKKSEAAKVFEELAKTSGTDIVALNNAAMLYADDLHDPARAVEFATRAYALAPDNASIMDTMGWTLARRGSAEDLQKAQALLERAHRSLKTGESGFHLGFVLIKRGEVERGKQLVQSSLAQSEQGTWRKEAEALL